MNSALGASALLFLLSSSAVKSGEPSIFGMRVPQPGSAVLSVRSPIANVSAGVGLMKFFVRRSNCAINRGNLQVFENFAIN